MSAQVKPHYCSTSCTYPCLRGVNDPEGLQRGAPASTAQYPRCIGFRCRAEIDSEVKPRLCVLVNSGKFDADTAFDSDCGICIS